MPRCSERSAMFDSQIPVAWKVPLAACFLLSTIAMAGESPPSAVLLEAEAFADRGGWVVDTQAMDVMGSPFVLAHGLGVPVSDAVTTVNVPRPRPIASGSAPATGSPRGTLPGRREGFSCWSKAKPSSTTFGTEGSRVALAGRRHRELAGRESSPLPLHDLTGFDGRCDAMLLTTDCRFPAAQRRSGHGRVAPQAARLCPTSRTMRASSTWSWSAAAWPAAARPSAPPGSAARSP